MSNVFGDGAPITPTPASQQNLADAVHAATSKVTPVDADELALVDSAAAFSLKKLTWGNTLTTLQATLGFIAAGAGAVQRTLQGKARDVISVKDFGAVGDGIVDDTAAIQAAFTAAGRGALFFPAGSYLVTAPINATSSFFGVGAATKFLPNGNFECFRMLMAPASGSGNLFARDYTVTYPATTTSASTGSIAHWFSKGGVSAATAGTNNFTMERVSVYNAYSGLYQSVADHGNMWRCAFRDIMLWDCVSYAINIDLTADSGSLEVVFENIVIDGASANFIATGKGPWLNGISKLRYSGVSSPRTIGALGTVARFYNIDDGVIDLQFESANITTASAKLIALANCKWVDIGITPVSCVVNVGVGNFVSWINIDDTTTNTEILRVRELNITVTSGTKYKVYTLATFAQQFRVTDRTVLRADCGGTPGAVLNTIQFHDIYATDTSVSSPGSFITGNKALLESTARVTATATPVIAYAWVDNPAAYQEPQAAWLLINGVSTVGPGTGFADTVLVVSSSNNTYGKILTVLSSNSVGGAVARTYSQDTAGNLLVAMASGTYYVRVTALHGYSPYR